jgi:hypothetical protein
LINIVTIYLFPVIRNRKKRKKIRKSSSKIRNEKKVLKKWKKENMAIGFRKIRGKTQIYIFSNFLFQLFFYFADL